MEEVFPMQIIESSENMVKVTFIAKEPGFYKILFSNEHSWMRAKTLKFRYVVLKPVTAQPVVASKADAKERIGYIHNDPSKKLDVKMIDKSIANPKISDQIVD